RGRVRLGERRPELWIAPGPDRQGRFPPAGQLGLPGPGGGRAGAGRVRRPGVHGVPRRRGRRGRPGEHRREPVELLVRVGGRLAGGAGHGEVVRRVGGARRRRGRRPARPRDGPADRRPRGQDRRAGRRRVPVVRLRPGQRRAALPALLGPGAAAGAGTGAARQPEPALRRRPRPAAVLRGDGRDAVTVASGRAAGPSLWMAAPALGLFGLFAAVPLLGVLVLSFMRWDGLGDPVWAGADNWGRTLTDPVTLNAMRLTVVVTVVSWLFQAPVSLLLGVFMAGRQRYRAVLSVLYFLPLLFSAAAVAIAFRALLDPNFGLGAALGAPLLAQDWIGSPGLALWVVLFVVGWCFVPFHSLLYQSGVRQIPASLYEAALLDGAGRVQQFFHITVPQLRYTIVTSSTLMIVGSLTYFDLIFVLTGGGPANATRILPLDMYLAGFRSYDMGRASVVAVILVVVGLGVSLALNRLSGANRMESRTEGA